VRPGGMINVEFEMRNGSVSVDDFDDLFSQCPP
jgi:hypothetical protein